MTQARFSQIKMVFQIATIAPLMSFLISCSGGMKALNSTSNSLNSTSTGGGSNTPTPTQTPTPTPTQTPTPTSSSSTVACIAPQDTQDSITQSISFFQLAQQNSAAAAAAAACQTQVTAEIATLQAKDWPCDFSSQAQSTIQACHSKVQTMLTAHATQSCFIVEGLGTQNWTNTGWSACSAASCNAGFSLSSGSCIASTQACTVANGTGQQTFSNGGYGACQITGCNSNYTNINGTCMPPVFVPSNSNQLVLSQGIQYGGYGIHYPEGLSAVKYIYGAEGTWKQYLRLQNVFGYYAGYTGAQGNQYPTGTNTTLLNSLLNFANGFNASSTSDANDHVLFQLGYQDGSTAAGTSFHEHNGRGIGGAVSGQAFTQFWFDDNWLARYMSLAYGAPPPSGLWAPSNFNRWQILAMDATNWNKYTGANIDEIVLNGLYDLSVGDTGSAWNDWTAAMNTAGLDYDSNNQRFSYPYVYAEYYMGLLKILTDKLMDAGVGDVNTLIQHSVSLHSNILSDEQYENGTPIGWITGDGSTNRNASSLINTETTATSVLGLGANARYVFEPGEQPLVSPAGFFLRSHHVLSAAIEGGSPSGSYMSYGPYMPFPAGSYVVDYFLRSPSPTGMMALVDVNDSTANTVLAQQTVNASQMASSNQWTRISLPVTIPNSTDNIEFRVLWYGTANMDVSMIRVR